MEVSEVAGPDRPNRDEAARAHARAQQRARQRLVERHREEFREFLEVEKAREGIRTLQPRQVSK
jgi:hypothetical protein